MKAILLLMTVLFFNLKSFSSPSISYGITCKGKSEEGAKYTLVTEFLSSEDFRNCQKICTADLAPNQLTVLLKIKKKGKKKYKKQFSFKGVVNLKRTLEGDFFKLQEELEGDGNYVEVSSTNVGETSSTHFKFKLGTKEKNFDMGYCRPSESSH